MAPFILLLFLSLFADAIEEGDLEETPTDIPSRSVSKLSDSDPEYSPDSDDQKRLEIFMFHILYEMQAHDISICHCFSKSKYYVDEVCFG